LGRVPFSIVVPEQLEWTTRLAPIAQSSPDLITEIPHL
jgi:hypothetical protein